MKGIKRKNRNYLFKKTSIFLALIFISTLFLGTEYAQISDINLSVLDTASSNEEKM